MPENIDARRDVRPPSKDSTLSPDFPPKTEVWQRMARICPSFNLSTKAVVLLSMPKDEYLPGFTIANAVNAAYKGTPIGEFSRENTVNLIQGTLEPIGLVAKTQSILHFGARRGTSYTPTEAGEFVGKPVAAAVLDFEQTHKFSLYPVLGHTATVSRDREAEKRAPILRSQILLSLAHTPNQSIISLAKACDTNRSILGLTIDQLVQAELVTKDSNNITFTVLDTESLINMTQPHTRLNSMDLITNACVSLSWDGKDITSDAVYKDVQASLAKQGQTINRNTVSELLNQLAIPDQHGKTYLAKSDEQLTHVSLTEKGALIANGFLTPLLDALQEGPTLTTWRTEILPKVQQNLATYAYETAEFVYPYTNHARLSLRGAIQIQVCQTITDSPDQMMDRGSLAKKLNISGATLYKYLTTMTNNGVLDRVYDDASQQYMYFLIADPTSFIDASPSEE